MNKTKILLLIAIPLLAVLFINAGKINPVSTDHPNVINAVDSTFADAIKDGVVIVDFWALRCPPCRVQGPILEDVAKEMNGKITVVKLDVDHNRTTPRAYKVRAIPTLIIFKDGKAVKRIVGLTQKKELKKILSSYID